MIKILHHKYIKQVSSFNYLMIRKICLRGNKQTDIGTINYPSSKGRVVPFPE